MSKTLTFEIPDELYKVFEEKAAREGRATEAVALEWLARTVYRPRPKLTEEERREAAERLRRHAGAVSSGDPLSADNDRIDADLAREYGDPHEEG
jgi:urease accessory protein UreE